MNNFFHENKRSALLLLGLLFILLIVLYFFFLQPLSKDLKSTKNQAMETESVIDQLHVQIENIENDPVQDNDIDRLRLTKQLPLTPESEEIILILEEIEQVSGSRIENISFSYDGSIPERTMEKDEEEETNQEEKNETEVDEEQSEIEEEPEADLEPVIHLEEKPEKLQILTVSVDVSSPNYEHYHTFLTEIEKQERMMIVSSMDFQKPGESELFFEEDPDESINSNIILTTFYYE